MSHIDIFHVAAQMLQENQRIAMATIIRTSGSTPAGPVAKMLVPPGGGAVAGTVGGGCMEAEVIREARIILDTGQPKICRYTLTEDDIEQGLICGGTLEVMMECLDKDALPLLKEITDHRQLGRDSVLISSMSPNAASSRVFIRDNQVDQSPKFRVGSPQHLAISTVMNEKRSTLMEADATCFIEFINGLPQLIIFGGGHCSRFIAQFAHAVGFQITVVDDRIKFANSTRFPQAAHTVVAEWENVMSSLDIPPQSYIVIVTRGHMYDEHVLEQVLSCKPAYVGMIGSKRKVTLTFKHLLERGVNESALHQVHAPIGLDIGGASPEEIGLSVVAELVKVRRNGRAGNVPHMRDRLPRDAWAY